jgi:anti-sigma-K factor RskA
VLGGGAFQLYLNQVVETVPLQGTVAAGTAVVVVHRSGATELQLNGLATPPTGQVYEAWVIPAGQQPRPAGTSRSGQATLPLPSSVGGSTVAVTLEPDPGSPQPTTPPFLAAPVPA